MALAAQTPDPLPTFEVTSVKPASGAQTVPSCTNGTYATNGMTLSASIGFAYSVELTRLDRLPDWALTREARYSIEGKAAKAVTEHECRLMVQSLLADRFQLKVHHELRTTAIYALVVGKNGAKLVKADESSAVNQVKINGAPGYDGVRGWSIATLAEFMGRGFPGTPVVDRTGLEGRYAIAFDFTVDRQTSPGDNMAAAVDRKLGLKLEPRKEPLDFIVVDRLEKPTQN